MFYASYQRGAGFGRATLLFLLGPVIWSLTEYLVHRFVFHLTPEEENEVRRTVGQLGQHEAAGNAARYQRTPRRSVLPCVQDPAWLRIRAVTVRRLPRV